MNSDKTNATDTDKEELQQEPSRNTTRGHNVASTSMQRHDVASMLSRRCINVMCPLGIGGLHQFYSHKTSRLILIVVHIILKSIYPDKVITEMTICITFFYFILFYSTPILE